MKECFAPVVLFDMSSMGAGEATKLSPEDIIKMWDKGLKSLEAIHHQVSNYLVEISGSDAEVFCYGIANHYLPNKTNRNSRTFVGSYDFTLTRESDQWIIRI